MTLGYCLDLVAFSKLINKYNGLLIFSMKRGIREEKGGGEQRTGRESEGESEREKKKRESERE